MINFLQSHWESIITTLSLALVGGQGFFVVFKNLRVNANINDLDKTVEKLLTGDFKEVKNAINGLTDYVTQTVNSLTKEFEDVIKEVKKDMTSTQTGLMKTFKEETSNFKEITNTEIKRINNLRKDLLGEKDEDVSSL